uniref:Uncharacterized protein n=1 Tax=Anopheles coluzzii TaxID=1518534 RepID=A0A8W7PBJ7_ANOCL
MVSRMVSAPVPKPHRYGTSRGGATECGGIARVLSTNGMTRPTPRRRHLPLLIVACGPTSGSRWRVLPRRFCEPDRDELPVRCCPRSRVPRYPRSCSPSEVDELEADRRRCGEVTLPPTLTLRLERRLGRRVAEPFWCSVLNPFITSRTSTSSGASSMRMLGPRSARASSSVCRSCESITRDSKPSMRLISRSYRLRSSSVPPAAGRGRSVCSSSSTSSGGDGTRSPPASRCRRRRLRCLAEDVGQRIARGGELLPHQGRAGAPVAARRAATAFRHRVRAAGADDTVGPIDLHHQLAASAVEQLYLGEAVRNAHPAGRARAADPLAKRPAKNSLTGFAWSLGGGRHAESESDVRRPLQLPQRASPFADVCGCSSTCPVVVVVVVIVKDSTIPRKCIEVKGMDTSKAHGDHVLCVSTNGGEGEHGKVEDITRKRY